MNSSEASSPTGEASAPRALPVGVRARCPGCGYDLRTITAPRCPECGLGFAWSELDRPRFHRHPFLFEEADSERSLAARFFMTYAAAHRPAKFWRSISRDVVPSLPRLRVFWAACVVLGVLSAWLVMSARNTWISYEAFKDLARRGVAPMPPLRTLLTPPSLLDAAVTGVPLVFWPVLSGATVWLFRGSLRRRGVRAAEVIRCLAYALPALNSVWTGFVVVVAIVPIIGQACFVYLCPIGIWCWYLRVAFREYLDVENPGVLIVVGHFVLLLFVFTVWLTILMMVIG